MSESLLTRCPHCDTTFRITQEHLQIAGGAVRCGACYQVFHAGEHIVQPFAETPPPPAPTPATVQARHEQHEPDIGEFELDAFDDLDEPAPAISAPVRPAPAPVREASPVAPSSSALEFDHDSSDFSLRTDDDFDEDFSHSLDEADHGKKGGKDSEDWARALLMELGEPIEDEDDTPAKKSAAKAQPASNTLFGSIDSGHDALLPDSIRTPDLSGEFSDSFKQVGNNETARDHFRLDEMDQEDEDPEAWAKAMLSDDAPAARGARAAVAPPPAPRVAPPPIKPRTLEDDLLDPFSDHDIDIDLPAPAAAATPIPSPVEPRFDNENIEHIDLQDAASALHSLALIPDESRHGRKSGQDAASRNRAAATPAAPPRPRAERQDGNRRNPMTLLIITGLVVVMLLAGIGIAKLNFDQWSRNANLRPLYAASCAVIGCKLPTQIDTSRIHTGNLAVRSHATLANALTVDTLMTNEASFTQPFPAIELSFQDNTGKVIARTTFTPGDYIRDPAIDIRSMPPRTPFHISVDVQDPGPAAVHYNLRFLAPGE